MGDGTSRNSFGLDYAPYEFYEFITDVSGGLFADA